MARRAREDLRAEALDVAEQMVVSDGPRALSMRELATRTGVSRQTLYSEFGDRAGVASALVLRATDGFLSRMEAALVGADDLYAAWSATVGAALSEAGENPLVKALLTGEAELFGADSGPMVDAAVERAVVNLARHWPDLDPADVALAAETATRLTVSHVVLPRHPPDVVAEQVATVVVRILRRG
ncbi:TetR family transcriptional regulator [Pseudonocardia endophytica]|uniref:TetR family transcriptional regulator n=2 Tax=Pseudonocardia endophytica TaxID=401976 RepID=A0A4R1HPB2_PSEEN|nr:TetR family transcriptional regulator [Pseudonocardia endophytica]